MKNFIISRWLLLLVTFALILQPALCLGQFSLQLEDIIQSTTNRDETIYSFRAVPEGGSKSDDWIYQWSIEGAGRIEYQKDGSQIKLIYPKQQVRQKTKVNLTLDAFSTSSSDILSVQYDLDIDLIGTSFSSLGRSSNDSTFWFTVGGIGAAAIAIAFAVGGGDDSDDACRNTGGDPSIRITSPEEYGYVGWTASVDGTVSNCENGDHVVVFIRPFGYGWYQQSSIGEISGGEWSVSPCYFGIHDNDNDIGRSFQIRAELRGSIGNVRATDTVRVIRNR